MAADALLALAAGTATGTRASRPHVVFVCDVRPAARGHTHGDEVCHVIGGGPVPVSVVREAAIGAFVKVALRDGTKVDTIVHYRRHIPAELRTVLELGDPERLDGAVCVEEGCDRRYGPSGTTTIRWPTTGSRATRTSGRGASPITGRRPSAIGRPASWVVAGRSEGRRDGRVVRRAGGRG